MKIKPILKSLSNLMFPEHYKCIVCGEEINGDNKYDVCEKCYPTLPFLEKYCLKCGMPIYDDGQYCIHCKGKRMPFVMARAPFVYEGVIADLIKKYKFDNKRYLAEPLSVFMVYEYFKQGMECDVVTFVPLHKNRQKKRGFNQSELLANYVAKQINLPVVNTLSRTVFKSSQVALGYAERQTNIQNSFASLNANEIKGKSVLLIDDIYTTGATSKRCASLLKNDGAKKVYVLTIAHTDLF